MGPGRIAAIVVAAALLAVYGSRAVVGVPAGFALARGTQMIFHDTPEPAIAEFEAGAVGDNRGSALRRAGDARLERWDALVAEQGLEATGQRLLREAARDYVLALCDSPASWQPWQQLSRIYQRIEERPRELSGDPPPIVPEDPWRGVGTAGRLTVGLLRKARERAPNWFAVHDVLAIRLGRYGLQDEALESVRQSARVLPVFSRHGYRMMPQIPPPILDAFSEGAWESLGQAPMLARLDQLIALGRLEWRRGAHEPAERALLLALEEPADPLSRAEIHYLLGGVLRAAERFDEAREQLELASRHPRFEAASLTALASMAQQVGEPQRAVELLRRLRWKDEQNLDYILRFVEATRQVRDWPATIEALNWARLIHPDDPRPHAELLETYLEMNDVAEATSLFRELRESQPPGLDLGRLERLIEAAKAPRPDRAAGEGQI